MKQEQGPKGTRNRRGKAPAPAPAGPPGKVRIIAGTLRRTPLPVADLPGLRPTPDRVRETVFNWLTHLLPTLEGTRGLDLFAGTGALGFELASRGAGRVVLVERDGKLAPVLARLAERLAPETVRVIGSDWRFALGRLAAERFDIVFLDPPFGAGLLAPALDAVRPLLATGGVVYAEAPLEDGPDALAPAGWESLRCAHAGAVQFGLLRPAAVE